MLRILIHSVVFLFLYSFLFKWVKIRRLPTIDTPILYASNVIKKILFVGVIAWIGFALYLAIFVSWKFFVLLLLVGLILYKVFSFILDWFLYHTVYTPIVKTIDEEHDLKL